MRFSVTIILLIGVIIWAIVDAKRGFITCFFSFVSTIVAILVVSIFSKSIIAGTNGLFGLEDLLGKGLGNWLGGVEIFNYDISPEGFESYIRELNLPEFFEEAIINKVKSFYEVNGWDTIEAGTTLAMLLGEATAGLAVNLISGFILFVLTKIVVSIALAKRVRLSIFLECM